MGSTRRIGILLLVVNSAAFMPKSANTSESTSATLTTTVLESVSYVRTVTEMLCTFRIYLDIESPIDISQFVEKFEPVELFHNEINSAQLHSPQNRFRSSCWDTVFSISKPDHEILQGKQIGNAIYDHFIFTSESRFVLERALLHGHVIDKVAIKYGIFVEKARDGKNEKKYFVEPEVYTETFVVSGNLSLTKKFNNLNGRILKTPVFLVAPIIGVDRDAEGKVVGYHGSHYNFTVEVSRRTNFTAYIYGEDMPAGKLLENGTWTGFVGEMANGYGDYCPIAAIVEDRYRFMTMTTLSYREAMVFCVKIPEPLLHWHALVFPLSKLVWIFVLSFFGTFVLLFILIVSFKLFRNSKFSTPVFLEEGIFLPFALFLEQNIRIPITPSARIAAISLIWLAFLIGTVYKTNLIGYLTFPEVPTIPRTFLQLHEHSEYTINLFGFSSLELQVLKASPRPAFKEIVKRVKIINDLGDCLISATKERTACIIWKYIGTAEMMKHMGTNPQLKSLFLSQDTATDIDIAVGLKKQSIHYEIMSRYSSAATEVGLIQKWIKDQMTLERDMSYEKARKNGNKKANVKKDTAVSETELSTENPESEEDEEISGGEKPLKVQNLVAIAYAYVFGCCVSFICLATELVITFSLYIMNRVNRVVDMGTVKLVVHQYNYGSKSQ